MKRRLSIRTPVALLAAAVAVISGAVVAQEATVTSEVRVQASGVIKKQVGKTSTGAPIEVAVITLHVGYGDLSLNTNSGQALLRNRVAYAAKDACARISSAYAPGTIGTGDTECIKDAIKYAKPQVDAAIAEANTSSR